MRVLQLTLCTGLLFFLMFMSIRVWSEGQTYRPFETTYWQAENSAEKLIVIPWEQNFFLEKHPTWILWADVYKDENQDLIVKPWADRNVPIRNLEKKTKKATIII